MQDAARGHRFDWKVTRDACGMQARGMPRERGAPARRGALCMRRASGVHAPCTAHARRACTVPCPALCVQVAVTGHAWDKHGACKKQGRECMVHAVRVSTQSASLHRECAAQENEIAALAGGGGPQARSMQEVSLCMQEAGGCAGGKHRRAGGLHALRMQGTACRMPFRVTGGRSPGGLLAGW